MSKGKRKSPGVPKGGATSTPRGATNVVEATVAASRVPFASNAEPPLPLKHQHVKKAKLSSSSPVANSKKKRTGAVNPDTAKRTSRGKPNGASGTKKKKKNNGVDGEVEEKIKNSPSRSRTRSHAKNKNGTDSAGPTTSKQTKAVSTELGTKRKKGGRNSENGGDGEQAGEHETPLQHGSSETTDNVEADLKRKRRSHGNKDKKEKDSKNGVKKTKKTAKAGKGRSGGVDLPISMDSMDDGVPFASSSPRGFQRPPQVTTAIAIHSNGPNTPNSVRAALIAQGTPVAANTTAATVATATATATATHINPVLPPPQPSSSRTAVAAAAAAAALGNRKAGRTPLRNRSPKSEYKSTLCCGLAESHPWFASNLNTGVVVVVDGHRRMMSLYSSFFGGHVDVYTAADDEEEEILYKGSDLAAKTASNSNKLAMYLSRRKGHIPGIYQASSFLHKGSPRNKLKSGCYFVSLAVCELYQAHLQQQQKKSDTNNVAVGSVAPPMSMITTGTVVGQAEHTPTGGNGPDDTAPAFAIVLPTPAATATATATAVRTRHGSAPAGQTPFMANVALGAASPHRGQIPQQAVRVGHRPHTYPSAQQTHIQQGAHVAQVANAVPSTSPQGSAYFAQPWQQGVDASGAVNVVSAAAPTAATVADVATVATARATTAAATATGPAGSVNAASPRASRVVSQQGVPVQAIDRFQQATPGTAPAVAFAVDGSTVVRGHPPHAHPVQQASPQHLSQVPTPQHHRHQYHDHGRQYGQPQHQKLQVHLQPHQLQSQHHHQQPQQQPQHQQHHHHQQQQSMGFNSQGYPPQQFSSFNGNGVNGHSQLSEFSKFQFENSMNGHTPLQATAQNGSLPVQLSGVSNVQDQQQPQYQSFQSNFVMSQPSFSPAHAQQTSAEHRVSQQPQQGIPSLLSSQNGALQQGQMQVHANGYLTSTVLQQQQQHQQQQQQPSVHQGQQPSQPQQQQQQQQPPQQQQQRQQHQFQSQGQQQAQSQYGQNSYPYEQTLQQNQQQQQPQYHQQPQVQFGQSTTQHTQQHQVFQFPPNMVASQPFATNSVSGNGQL